MTLLLLGLVLFLGAHSVRIVAEPWRQRVIARRGERVYKGLHALVSLAGFALIVAGYGLAREQPLVLWQPPLWTRHLAAVLVLAAFVLISAAYVPRNAIRARLGHPMLIGTKVWAVAHLIANQTLADLLLFGAFLAWAVLALRAAKARDRAIPVTPARATAAGTATAVLLGVAGWALFAFWAHAALIGVQPFARGAAP